METFNLTTLDHALSLGLPIQGHPPLSSCELRVDRYVPVICTCLHGGRQLRAEVKEALGIDGSERHAYEDPYLARLVKGQPITLVAHDSPLDYDLDRPAQTALHPHHTGGGKGPGKYNLAQSLARYHEFYEVLQLLVQRLLGQFGSVLVYDFQGYTPPPQTGLNEATGFDLTTPPIDHPQYRKIVGEWLMSLREVRVGSYLLPVAENHFRGQPGRLASYLHERFYKVLVLPTTVRRIYQDGSGHSQPQLLKGLQKGLKGAIKRTSKVFLDSLDDIAQLPTGTLSRRTATPVTRQVDEELAQISERIELLIHLTPRNSDAERRRFLKSGSPPRFRYAPLEFDLQGLRRRLYQVPIENVEEPELSRLFRQTQGELRHRLTLLEERGQPYFLPTSVKLYGAPDRLLCDAARRLLLLADDSPEQLGPTQGAGVAKQRALDLAHYMGSDLDPLQIATKITPRLSDRMACRGQTLFLRKDALYSDRELAALLLHEVGTQLTLTQNGARQPLKLFAVGFGGSAPDGVGMGGATRTSLGLGVMMEFLHGALTHRRLRDLAARVVAIQMLLQDAPFPEVARQLEDYGFDEVRSYQITERVFRGGGLTRDYLYLAGAIDLFRYTEAGGDLKPLLCGRFPLSELPVLARIARGALCHAPHFLPPVLYPKPTRHWPLAGTTPPQLPHVGAASRQLPGYALLAELAEASRNERGNNKRRLRKTPETTY